MAEFTNLLERVGDRVSMPEPAMHRLDRRRRRLERNRRIGTAAIALLVAIAAIGGAMAMFREGTRTRPAGVNEGPAITPQNVGDLHLAWTATTHIANGLREPVVVHDGAVYLSSDHLYQYPVDCRSDGGECQSSWFGPTLGSRAWLRLDGQLLYVGNDAYDLGCQPDPCSVGSLDFLGGEWGPAAVADGVAYEVDGAGVLRAGYCRPLSTNGSECGLLWKAHTRPASGGGCGVCSLITVADGKVVVADNSFGGTAWRGDGRIVEFDARCGHRGRACAPRWIMNGDFGQPVAGDGLVFASNPGGLLMAFPEDCRVDARGLCQPSWVGPVGQDPTASTLANGVVYTGSRSGTITAYRTGCTPHAAGPGGPASGVCDPLWWGRASPWSVPMMVDDRIVASGGTGPVAVFRVDCADADGECGPLWTASTEGTAVAAAGVLYVAPRDGHTIVAYDLGCRSDGGTCRPIWTGTIPAEIRSGPVVAAGGVYIGGGDGRLYVFRVRMAHGGGAAPPVWIPALAVLLALAVGGLVRRGRRGAVPADRPE